ncbi:uncharacterized protein [Nicotiana tomentosiformis]|uniref:uncharacterized protein n=1 Tax=Nicotiana tomentosiformis TaxID=4098 RepID=UPI00388C5DAB
MKKTPEEIVTTLDELSEDANQWPSESAKRRRSTGVHQVDVNTSVHVHLEDVAKEIQKLTLASIQNETHAACNICGRGHPTHECQASTKEVNVVGNYNFNAMGHKHPRFSWSSTGEDLMKSFMVKTNERFEIQGAIIRNLEKQVGHIATILSERVLKTLPTDTEKNPKETVNDVTMRSGQVLKDPTLIQNDVILERESGEQLKKKVEKKKKEEKSRRDGNKKINHMPALPFHQNLCREKLDKQNAPQMLACVKFLKEILTKKRKIYETSVVKLTEHCSAILQNKLPQKYGDRGSFAIPCSLGTINFDKSLCDSGASINLIPLSIYSKLEKEIGEIRSAPISLQLVDQTTLIHEGIVEDVLVWVDKFVFPVDCIVVNMKENKDIPLILGRPFLATGRDILDIHEIKLMRRMGEETMTFKMDVKRRCKKKHQLRVLSE